MIALNYRKRLIKGVIILVLVCGWLIIPAKNSLAVNPVSIGFMIEAAQMEGDIQELDLINGETLDQKERPMLEMNFAVVSAEGLSIKKLVQTKEGTITTEITAKKNVLFKKLKLKVTNATFSGTYVPEQGVLGLKNVKLLVHNITTESSNLPQFNLEFKAGGEVELKPKSKQELIQIKSLLESLVKPTDRGRQDQKSQTESDSS